MTPNLQYHDMMFRREEELRKLIAEIPNEEIVSNLSLWLEILLLKGKMHLQKENRE